MIVALVKREKRGGQCDTVVFTKRQNPKQSYCLYALLHVGNEVCTLLFTLRNKNPELEKFENTTT